jgi:tetratricopeptide (TPR) repeat protein
MESQELLPEALHAARTGQRQAARSLFLQIVQQDPGCELAWLWLSDVQDDPVECMHALQQALAINPNNTPAQARLHQLIAAAAGSGETTSSQTTSGALFTGASSQPYTVFNENLSEPVTAKPDGERTWRDPHTTSEEQDAYHQALHLAKFGKYDPALGLLHQLVEVHEQRADAWLLIAQLSPRTADKIAALQKVLALQPDNRKALARLHRLEKLERDPLLLGAQHEERGEREQAAAVYQWISTHSRSATDRLEANRRIGNLRLLQESEALHPLDPTLNLLRLTFGPALFFALLIFIQSGLNPFKIPLISLLGEASVLAGSLLVTVTGLRPMHPRWVKQFGRPGTGKELEMRFSLRLLGWALLIAPYLLFIIEALHRIALFRTSMDY